MFLMFLSLCYSIKEENFIKKSVMVQDIYYLDQTNTFSPKQTPTPITFNPTPSATNSNSKNVFVSLEMIIFYIILAIVVVIVIVGIIIYRCCKKKEITMTVNPSEVNAIEAMNQPLADNPNLPDEGLVQI